VLFPKTSEYFPPKLLQFPHQNFGVENLKPKIKRMKKKHIWGSFSLTILMGFELLMLGNFRWAIPNCQ
jgi:hypothetical protein